MLEQRQFDDDDDDDLSTFNSIWKMDSRFSVVCCQAAMSFTCEGGKQTESRKIFKVRKCGEMWGKDGQVAAVFAVRGVVSTTVLSRRSLGSD